MAVFRPDQGRASTVMSFIFCLHDWKFYATFLPVVSKKHVKVTTFEQEGGTDKEKNIYIYICIYDKWNYHLDKATPAPFLYCYYYYYYICLFGWLRCIGEVSMSDISD